MSRSFGLGFRVVSRIDTGVNLQLVFLFVACIVSPLTRSMSVRSPPHRDPRSHNAHDIPGKSHIRDGYNAPNNTLKPIGRLSLNNIRPFHYIGQALFMTLVHHLGTDRAPAWVALGPQTASYATGPPPNALRNMFARAPMGNSSPLRIAPHGRRGNRGTWPLIHCCGSCLFLYFPRCFRLFSAASLNRFLICSADQRA